MSSLNRIDILAVSAYSLAMTTPGSTTSEPVSIGTGEGIVLMILASGGHILIHSADEYAEGVARRFTLHTSPADTVGQDLSHNTLRVLRQAQMLRYTDTPIVGGPSYPRPMGINPSGLECAVEYATAMLTMAMAAGTTAEAPFSADQRQILLAMHDGVTLSQHAVDAWALGADDVRAFDVRVLTGIGFIAPAARQWSWRLRPAGRAWCEAFPR